MKKTIVALFAITTLTACPNGPGPVIGKAVVDCLGENRPQIDALLGEFKPLLLGGGFNWDNAYQRGKQAGLDVGGCFIAELVNYYFGKGFRSAPDAETANETLAKIRNDNGGASFRTMCARQDGSTTECKL